MFQELLKTLKNSELFKALDPSQVKEIKEALKDAPAPLLQEAIELVKKHDSLFAQEEQQGQIALQKALDNLLMLLSKAKKKERDAMIAAHKEEEHSEQNAAENILLNLP